MTLEEIEGAMEHIAVLKEKRHWRTLSELTGGTVKAEAIRVLYKQFRKAETVKPESCSRDWYRLIRVVKFVEEMVIAREVEFPMHHYFGDDFLTDDLINRLGVERGQFVAAWKLIMENDVV